MEQQMNRRLAALAVAVWVALLGCSGGGGGGEAGVGPAVVESPWSLKERDGILEVAYGGGSRFPQIGALHLDSGYLRLTYLPDGTFGTSVCVLPAFWSGGVYFQGAPVTAAPVIDGNDLLMPFSGTIGGVTVQGTIRWYPPASRETRVRVEASLTGTAALDVRPGEAFKPCCLATMRVSDTVFDGRAAIVGTRDVELPSDGWILPAPETVPVLGFRGGTSNWKTNAPTIKVSFDEAVMVTGWVTASSDPNHDHISLWPASSTVMTGWRYVVSAAP